MTQPSIVSVLAPSRVVQNAVALCRRAAHEPGPNLRVAFLRSVNRLQRHRVRFDPRGLTPFLNFFEHASVEERATLRHVMNVSRLPRDWQYSVSARKDIMSKTRRALAQIRALDSDLAVALNTIVGTVLYARRKGLAGGSVFDTIGAIWLSPAAWWTSDDYAENIVHEYVHQCLYLEDVVHGLITRPLSEMANRGALVISAVLERKRPFYASFHSAFVALALVSFWLCLLRSSRVIPPRPKGSKDTLAELVRREAHERALMARVVHARRNLMRTVEALESKQQLLTEHGKRALAELKAVAEAA